MTNQLKSGLKLSFFCHFLKFGSLVSHLNWADDRLGQCPTASRKNEKINFGAKNVGWNYVFCHFLKFAALVSFDISQVYLFHYLSSNTRSYKTNLHWNLQLQHMPNI